MRWQIEQFIHEDVRSDIHGDLYGVERAADAIVNYIRAELVSVLQQELEQAYGARGDGLSEAIEFIQEQFKEKSNA
jgi:hypothetical protein